MTGRFTMDELDDLAFRVGIDKEAFGGETLPARAHALVMYAAKHLMMADFVSTAAAMRPDVDWPPDGGRQRSFKAVIERQGVKKRWKVIC